MGLVHTSSPRWFCTDLFIQREKRAQSHRALYLQRAALKCKNLVVSADETYISMERACGDEESPQVPVLARVILAGAKFWWGCGHGEGMETLHWEKGIPKTVPGQGMSLKPIP